MKMGNNLKTLNEIPFYTIRCCQSCGKISTLTQLLVQVWNDVITLKKFDIIKKLSIHILCQTAVPFLGIYTYIHTRIYTYKMEYTDAKRHL